MKKVSLLVLCVVVFGAFEPGIIAEAFHRFFELTIFCATKTNRYCWCCTYYLYCGRCWRGYCARIEEV